MKHEKDKSDKSKAQKYDRKRERETQRAKQHLGVFAGAVACKRESVVM